MDPKFPSPHSPIFLPVKPFFFDTTQSTSRKPAIPSIPHSYHRPKHISTGYHESCSKHGRSDQLKGRGRGAGAGAHRRVWTRQSRVGRPSAFFSRMSSSANEDARCKPVGESLATTGRLAVDPTPCPCRTPPSICRTTWRAVPLVLALDGRQTPATRALRRMLDSEPPRRMHNVTTLAGTAVCIPCVICTQPAPPGARGVVTQLCGARSVPPASLRYGPASLRSRY